MKKITVTAIMMAAVLSTYGAIIGVDWQATYGFYYNATPGSGMNTSGQALAQLIYSPDANVDAASIGGGVTGDDQIWRTMIVTSEWGDFGGPGYAGTATPLVGYVYARIFQDNNVQGGDWYFYTPVLQLVDRTNPTPGDPQLANQLVEMNTSVDGNSIQGAQVIPEPATFLLFAIGGMGAWMIRRNKMQIKEEADA